MDVGKIHPENDLTVVQSIELIEASYCIVADEFRLICLACSKVDSSKARPRKITLLASDFASSFGLGNPRTAYSRMLKAARSLIKKPVVLAEKKGDGIKLVEMNWIESNEFYINKEKSIDIVFTKKITPYLFNLKEWFTTINFEYASKLNTPFSFRLYFWLSSQKFKQVEGGVSVDLDLDWMKDRAHLHDKYARFDVFKRKVLDPAIEKINEKTDITIEQGATMFIRGENRKIKTVRFFYSIDESEQSILMKPNRPKLKRRPKVIAGSHAEREWLQHNFKLLSSYRDGLKPFNKRLTLADLRTLARGAKLFHPDLEKKLNKEIAEREKDHKKRVKK